MSAADAPPDRATSDCQLILTLFAGYGGAVGALAVPMGLFVGPHILFAAIGHLLAAVAAAALGWGLAGRTAWARWGVRGLALLLLVAAAVGFCDAWTENRIAAYVLAGLAVLPLALLVRSFSLPQRAA